jgi:hypothetical protein
MNEPPDEVRRGRLSEAAMVGLLTAHLQSQGYRVRHEVPNMGQQADVVATRGRWVTFIEAKLAQWPRALAQCRAHEHVADFICIAVATRSIPEPLRVAAMSRGYGVIVFRTETNAFELVIPPKRNPRVWRPQRQQWSLHLRGLAHVG